MKKIFCKIMFYCPMILLLSCGSKVIVPTKDICSLEKHYDDNIFQVKINDQAINQHWYIYQEALDVAALLATQNKCRPLEM